MGQSTLLYTRPHGHVSHMYTDCTSLSLCSYQYISTRCLEVASSGHVALHGPEVGVEHLLGAAAAAGAPLQSWAWHLTSTGLPLSSGILLYCLSSMYRGLPMTFSPQINVDCIRGSSNPKPLRLSSDPKN